MLTEIDVHILNKMKSRGTEIIKQPVSPYYNINIIQTSKLQQSYYYTLVNTKLSHQPLGILIIIHCGELIILSSSMEIGYIGGMFLIIYFMHVYFFILFQPYGCDKLVDRIPKPVIK